MFLFFVLNFKILNLDFSPVKGPEGNIEYLLYLKKKLNENEENVLRPTLVSFRDNSILNLSLPENEDIHIVDIMKTMDNRYIFSK